MIWNLGKVTPYGECYPRDLFRQIVSNPMKGAMNTDISWCKQAYLKGWACLFSCKNVPPYPFLPFRLAGIHDMAHK